jgi:hypothetical protein
MLTSALPAKADIDGPLIHVGFEPRSDIDLLVTCARSIRVQTLPFVSPS